MMKSVFNDDIDIDAGDGGEDGSEDDSSGAFKWPANVPHPLLIPDVCLIILRLMKPSLY